MKLCVIPGDGIGQEVIPAAVQVLERVLPQLQISQAEAGWGVFEATGQSLPAKTISAAKEAGAVLFGAVSSPLYQVEGYRSPIVGMRRALDTFANLRPARKWLDASDFNLLVVRENTEGLYVGAERVERDADGRQKVITERVISEVGSERVAKFAFELAQNNGQKLTIVHKANVIRQGDGLWRRVCLDVAQHYPDVSVNEGLVDALAYHLVRQAEAYQLLLCPNLYGDILSDLVSGLADGLGMAPSLSVGQDYAIAEPVHGSAPDIAGQGIANPIAAILSGAMLCRYWWKLPTQAEAIEQAVQAVLDAGYRTADMPASSQNNTILADTQTISSQILKQLD